MASRKTTKRAAKPVDHNAARELELYIENDYSLVGEERGPGKSIEAMLKKKIERGNFDADKSVRAWEYLIEAGAKKYAKEFAAERDWPKLFDVPTRTFVAKRFAEHFATENEISRERAELEQKAFETMHRDYRGQVDGQRAVLVNAKGGATLTPLRSLSTVELKKLIEGKG
jgi:hypothetical protein